MIAYNIRGSPFATPNILKFGFSIWARKPPKNYLSIYPKAIQKIRKKEKSNDIFLYALVDDVLPKVVLSRTHEEQQKISEHYINLLPNLGFHEVHLVSNFVKKTALEVCLSYANGITVSEFWKLLPQSKKKFSDNLTLAEAFGFLWHIHVLKAAFDEFQLTGLLAGIRSEFFYLIARKLLPPHDVYFINTS